MYYLYAATAAAVLISFMISREKTFEALRIAYKRFAEFQYRWEALGELPDIQPAPGFYLEVCKKISGSNDRRLIPRLRQAFQFLPSPLAMAAYLVIGLLAGTYLGNFMSRGAFSLRRSQESFPPPGSPSWLR